MADDAIVYYMQAMDIYRKNKKHKEEAQATNNLASAFVKKNKTAEALSTYQQAIALNMQYNMPENLTSNYEGLAELYEKTGDSKKSLEYLTKVS